MEIVLPNLGPAERIASLHSYVLSRQHAGVLGNLGLAHRFGDSVLPDPAGDLLLHAAWLGHATLLRPRLTTATWLLTLSMSNDYSIAAAAGIGRWVSVNAHAA
jgi:hypothetical protein